MRLVDQKVVDISLCEDGYYGYSALIFYYCSFFASKLSMECTNDDSKHWKTLLSKWGPLEVLRKEPITFVPSGMIKSWMSNWKE